MAPKTQSSPNPAAARRGLLQAAAAVEASPAVAQGGEGATAENASPAPANKTTSVPSLAEAVQLASQNNLSILIQVRVFV